MELMVAVLTEDECFSVASGHHLLPQSFSFGDIFHLPYVMNLKRSLCGFTVFALPSVQPFEHFGSAERPYIGSGLLIEPGVAWQRLLEVFEPEYSDDAGLLFPWDDECISIVGFEPLGDFIDAGLVLVCQSFQQAHPPYMSEFVHPRFGI